MENRFYLCSLFAIRDLPCKPPAMLTNGADHFTAHINLNQDKPSDVKNWKVYRSDSQLNQQMHGKTGLGSIEFRIVAVKNIALERDFKHMVRKFVDTDAISCKNSCPLLVIMPLFFLPVLFVSFFAPTQSWKVCY